MRWVWDGHCWARTDAPRQSPFAPRYVSGLSRGGHWAWAAATVLTGGVAAIGWALHVRLARRRIS